MGKKNPRFRKRIRFSQSLFSGRLVERTAAAATAGMEEEEEEAPSRMQKEKTTGSKHHGMRNTGHWNIFHRLLYVGEGVRVWEMEPQILPAEPFFIIIIRTIVSLEDIYQISSDDWGAQMYFSML